MIKIKLDYFTLLSPSPVYFDNIGGIKSPTLKEIREIGYDTYVQYIWLLNMDIQDYYTFIEKNHDTYFQTYTDEQKEIVYQVKNEYELMSQEQKKEINFFNIMVFDTMLVNMFCNMFNFFFVEDVAFDEDSKCFITRIKNSEITRKKVGVINYLRGLFSTRLKNTDKPVEAYKTVGIIHVLNYIDISDIILQRLNMTRSSKLHAKEKVKNKAAAKILEKLRMAKNNSNSKQDKKLELPNIISSLSSHSKSINILNIWDLTVYQLYDQFKRIRLDDSYNISSLSVAAWGDSEGKFDNTIWFSNMSED